MKQKLKWAALIVLGLLIAFVAATVTTTYNRPLGHTSYYMDTMEQLLGLTQKPDGDTIQVGWAKVNLEPPYPTPISIDARREGVYESILDSIYVRTVVFDNGIDKAALVTIDMLIFPPSVMAVLNDSLAETGFSLDNVYLTATHTHSSIGAWAPGIIGEIFSGAYDPAIVAHIAHCVAQSIRLAAQDVVKAQIGFNKVDAHELVYNRLIKDSVHTDPWLRYIRITRDDGKNAIITSFAAHATFLHDSIMKLHRDYPGLLVDSLETLPDIDFALFGAGAMGSMGPAFENKGAWRGMEQMAGGLRGKIMKGWLSTSINYLTQLNSAHVPIYLPEEQVRLSNSFRLRPWVVRWLFGNNPHHVAGLRLGNTVLVGTPCDFSGELVAEVDSFAQAQGINLMVTSFNGDFVGYITHDRHYCMDAYETRTMNWFGPHNGRFFQDIIMEMVRKL